MKGVSDIHGKRTGIRPSFIFTFVMGSFHSYLCHFGSSLGFFPKKLYRKFMLFLEMLLVCFVYTTGTTHPMGCIYSPGLQPHRFAEMAAHTLSLSHLLMKKIIDVTLWLLPNFISCVSKKINEFFYHVCFKIAPAWKVRFMFNHVLFTI